MKRTRIRSQSARHRRESAGKAEIRRQVLARDRICVLKGSTTGRCFGPLTVHHLWKDGQGGVFKPWNLLTLCKHHNDQIEVLPRDDVEAWGLVIAYGMNYEAAWRRMVFAGLVHWWWDGTDASEPFPVIPEAA